MSKPYANYLTRSCTAAVREKEVAFVTVARYSNLNVGSDRQTSLHSRTQVGRIHMTRLLAQSLKAIARETGAGNPCPRSYSLGCHMPALPANKDWTFMR